MSGRWTVQIGSWIFIRRALNATNGNISATSEKLDIGRSTVYRKMQEYGINIEDYQTV
ncbi:MAG: helix-turn-helix domain-containing protein [Planctomycetota bacterium]